MQTSHIMENYKFEIGDIVKHKAYNALAGIAPPMLIITRGKQYGQKGVETLYLVSCMGNSFIRNFMVEEELCFYKKPERNVEIKKLNISQRAKNVASAAGFKYLEEVADFGITDLERVRNMGRRSINEFTEEIKVHGLKWNS